MNHQELQDDADHLKDIANGEIYGTDAESIIRRAFPDSTAWTPDDFQYHLKIVYKLPPFHIEELTNFVDCHQCINMVKEEDKIIFLEPREDKS